MEFKTQPARSLNNSCQLFLKDLNALPEDAFCRSLGGKARTVADIAHEVNLVNDHVGQAVRGEEQFVWPEGWISAPPELCSKEAVIKAFEESSQRIVETFTSYSQEQLDETIKHDEGETTRAERCRFITLHLWYHSGQLNYIQTLLGDDG